MNFHSARQPIPGRLYRLLGDILIYDVDTEETARLPVESLFLIVDVLDGTSATRLVELIFDSKIYTCYLYAGDYEPVEER